MIKIGLTGVMGSGKSTAAAHFRKRGYEVLDLDALAKDSLNRKDTQDDIRKTFGAEYVDGSKVNVEKLRLAFSCAEDLQKLEQIIHPRVYDDLARLISDLEKKGATAVVLDHPLLFETGFHDMVDITMVVTAAMGTIRKRLKERGVEASDMERRLAVQLPLSEKERMADYVIDNNGTKDQLGEQIDAVIEQITTWR